MRGIFRFFVLLLAISSFGQSNNASLSGRVLYNGKPVSGAEVILVRDGQLTDFNVKAIADLSGVYRFENLAPGKYLITASKGSHVVMSGRVVVRSGVPAVIDLELESIGVTVTEPITISAAQSQTIDEVSKTVNVIDGQEMRDRADFTLVDTLRSIPGFRVQQLGGFGRTANIKTRGLRNQDTAVLIDGVRFRDASAITGDASPFLSDLTLTSVSKIEVLRGSGSSLYGTNAIGGVIDFQTPDPQEGWHGQVSGTLGGLGLGRFRGNLSNASRDGKIGFNAGFSRTVYTKGIDGDDDANNSNFQSKLIFQPSANTNLSGRFFFSDAFVRLNSNPDTTDSVPLGNFGIIDAREGVNFIPDADDPDDTQESRFFNGQFVATHVINKRLVINGYYSGLATRRRNNTGPLGVGFQSASKSVFDGMIQTANVHLNWTPNYANQVTAGYEFEHETFGNDGSTPNGSGNFTSHAFQSSHTVYVQDLVSWLNGKLQLAGGVRAQLFRLSSPKFSLINAPYSTIRLVDPPTALTFDGAASYYIPRTSTKLRAHIGNGYRVPSLFERFGTFFDNFSVPNRFVALGDPGLKPEKSIAVDGGVEQDLLRARIHLSAVYFYTKLTDTIGFGNIAPRIGMTERPFGGYENQKGGIARGAEFSGSITPSESTDLFASYTFTNSDQREPQVFGSGVIETLGIPNHQFTFVGTQRFRRFWINIDLLLASNYLAPIFSNASFNSYVFRFKGNRRADITAGYTFASKQDRPSFRLFGTIENVFGDRYFENGFRTPGRNARVGVSLGF